MHVQPAPVELRTAQWVEDGGQHSGSIFTMEAGLSSP
jgi:hypothetical protein